jgi:hypothetical protein
MKHSLDWGIDMKLTVSKFKFQFVVLLVSILKIAYAVSRPLFYSGPDANGYMPAALAFAKLGYFSEGIPYLPTYPTGYPILLSILIRVFGDNWIYAAQIIQILLFAFGTILLRGILIRYFSKAIGSISGYLIILSPAWFVANGEAMYETLLYFYLSVSFYFFLTPTRMIVKKFQNCILGSLVSVLAISTHPRVLIIYVLLFITYIYKNRYDLRAMFSVISVSVSIVSIGIGLIGYLSVVRTGIFTLSSAFWPSMTQNKVFSGCSNVKCMATRIFESPINFFQESLSNFFEFWSPHSGSLAKGTWFHNISFLAQLVKMDLPEFSIMLGLVTTLIVFASWVFGTSRLWVLHKGSASVLVTLICISFFSVDVLVYGDNRHRLIALIFMLPAHGVTATILITKVKSYMLKNFGKKAWP